MKRFAILAATLAAAAISLVGAQQAMAANPVRPAQGPSGQPTASATPGVSTSQATMPGMSDEEMAGMDHEAPPAASHDETAGMDPDMPGMSHDETPGMDPDMPGMSHDETPGMDPDMPGMSGSGAAHGHAATEGSESRPQAAVVGTFVVLNGGVLLTAGLMRRRAKLHPAKPSRGSRPAK